MKYYVLIYRDVFDKNGNKYSEQLEENLSFPNSILSKDDYILQECPKCGYKIIIKENKGLCTLELDNDNFGDIVFNSLDAKHSIVMSKKMLEIIQPEKGIKSIEKVQQIFVKGKLLENPPSYYMIELNRSTLTISRKNSILKNPIKKRKIRCPICNPDKRLYLTIEKLAFDREEEEYNIFTLYENNDLIIINEDFLSLCINSGLSNITERAVPINDFKQDLLN